MGKRILEIAKKKVSDMTLEEKYELTNDWIIRNLIQVANEYPLLKEYVDSAVKCIKTNKVDVYNFRGLTLTTEVLNDDDSIIFWTLALLFHCKDLLEKEVA